MLKDLKHIGNLKKLGIICLLTFIGLINLNGQNSKSNVGKISFVSSQNIYVKFVSTDHIELGDTLYILKDEQLVPILQVEHKSSISCVCKPISDDELKQGFEIIAKEKHIIIEKEEEIQPEKEEEIIVPDKLQLEPEELPDSFTYKQSIKGRLSASSYSNIYKQEGRENKHRMKYAFSFKGNHLNDSKFSMESYIIFKHTLNEWEVVSSNIKDALKVYSLAVKYNFSEKGSIWAGRKINPKVSGIGAIDGIHFENSSGNMTYGALVGSRPDHGDYGWNIDLFEAGAFVSHQVKKKNISTQSTLAFLELRNNSNVDRRYMYFQHRANLFKKFNFFSFFEFDLFEKINDQSSNVFRLTNLYLSLRYRVSRNLNLSASYDARNNVIYYETYKNFIDRLIENETRQGLRFSINFKPIKLMRVGFSSSFRFQKDEENKSRNISSYITYSRIPLIKFSATIRGNFLSTNYIESKIFGIRLSKEIIPGKLSGDFYFRKINYNYVSSEITIAQKVAGTNLNWRIQKKLSLSLYFEGTFENEKENFRINTKLIKRIR
jgi:hypothetical protein